MRTSKYGAKIGVPQKSWETTEPPPESLLTSIPIMSVPAIEGSLCPAKRAQPNLFFQALGAAV